MSAVEILRQARELIADKGRWTQGVFAKDAQGQAVFALADEAVCWCAEGAIRRFAALGNSAESIALVDVLAEQLYGAHIVDVNDGDVDSVTDPHSAVLHLLDIAIEKAEAANA